jgi:hypothetical protein
VRALHQDWLPVTLPPWPWEPARNVQAVPALDQHPVLPQRSPGLRLSDLPPLPRVVPVREVKPLGKVVLAGSDGRPVLVVGRYGLGRTAVLLSGDTNRWARGGEAAALWHAALLRRAVTWAGGRDPAAQSGLRVKLSTYQAEPDQMVAVEARLLGPLRAAPGLKLTAHIQPRSSSDPTSLAVGLSGDDGLHLGRFSAPQIDGPYGDYIVTVRASNAAGHTLAQARVPLVVVSRSPEMDDLRPDHAHLQALADATGGRVWHRDEAAALAAELARLTSPRRHEITERTPRWNRLWVLLALVGLVVAEWAVRRG